MAFVLQTGMDLNTSTVRRTKGMVSQFWRFRHLALATSVGTFLLILLGVYTGAIGAGLACEARWPFCDGWLGLFPANWPSFVEWFHRLVAMIIGFLILGLVYGSWRYYEDTRIRVGATVAVLVLPVQIVLGGVTVRQYGPEITTIHHAAALVIFAAVVATTLWIYEADRRND